MVIGNKLAAGLGRLSLGVLSGDERIMIVLSCGSKCVCMAVGLSRSILGVWTTGAG